jgi:hypothetical protein
VIAAAANLALALQSATLAGAAGPGSGQTLDVRTFGAAAPGDATGAINAAINAAAPDDTIWFPKGDYQVSTIILRSALTYRGEAGAVLHGKNGRPIMMVSAVDSHDITVDGLGFDGRDAAVAISLAGTGAAASVNRVRVVNSTFRQAGIAFDYLKHSRISGNRFLNTSQSAIGGHHADNSTISDNIFDECDRAIGLAFDGTANTGRNVVVADNVGTGMTGMAIEIIGHDPPVHNETQNLLVKGNSFSGWRYLAGMTDTIAYSIVTDGGTGTQVLDNYARNGLHTGYGIELSGPGALARGNYIDGFYTGIIAYSAGDIIERNNVINFAGTATDTYGRADEVVRDNTSDPLQIPPLARRG